MQQFIISNLLQFNVFQITILAIQAVLFFVAGLIALISEEKIVSFFCSVFFIMTLIGVIVVSIVFSNDARKEVETHMYAAIKNGKALEIESKSDLIKSRKFEIDSEDADHIYVKVNRLLWSNTFIINKSDIDEVKN
jgi:hypothetical protein